MAVAVVMGRGGAIVRDRNIPRCQVAQAGCLSVCCTPSGFDRREDAILCRSTSNPAHHEGRRFVE